MSASTPRERVARIHTAPSNRKARDSLERKVVYKSVLESPFHLKWPNVPANIQNAILARIVEMLPGVAEYHLARQLASRTGKKKRSLEKKAKIRDERAQKRRKLAEKAVSTAVVSVEESSSAGPSGSTVSGASTKALDVPDVPMEEGQPIRSSAPPILSSVTIGINEVTKRLEAQARGPRCILSTSDSPDQAHVANPEPRHCSLIRVVLVCRADIDPPLLVAHLPQLVAACNSNVKDPTQFVKLVSLPKNAEFSLAETMGLRRVAVFALHSELSQDPSLATLLESVPPLVAPWLLAPLPTPTTKQPEPKLQSASGNELKLIPTHVKQMRTTAPKDMRAAKEHRAKGRAQAKQKKTERKTEQKKVEDAWRKKVRLMVTAAAKTSIGKGAGPSDTVMPQSPLTDVQHPLAEML